MKKTITIVICSLLLGCSPDSSSNERETIAVIGASDIDQYFESVKSHSAELRSFLGRFPKGADLHNHLDGSIYAETYIAWAAADGKCVRLTTMSLSLPPCDQEGDELPVADVINDVGIVNELIDSLSVRNYGLRPISGHDQFFGTFGRFYAATVGREADMLADTTARASRQNILYLELMQTFGMEEAIAIGKDHKEFADLGDLDALLTNPALEDLVATTQSKTDAVERDLKHLQQCNGSEPADGCDVKVRYLATVLRSFSRSEVAAQVLLAFKLVERDSRYVGLNLAMPEDMPSILADYSWQMELIRELAKRFPVAAQGVTLHAGELALGLVPPRDLRFHIGEAVNVAGAKRIGHGTSVAYENDFETLLRTMSEREILVEINLTSEQIILGVVGDEHPIGLFRRYDVPIALSTDDEGVARGDLTQEYQIAVEMENISYAELKQLSRNSLAYSFLPGDGLFTTISDASPVAACEKEVLGSKVPSVTCSAFLTKSEKAQAQWELERRFREFDTTYMWPVK